MDEDKKGTQTTLLLAFLVVISVLFGAFAASWDTTQFWKEKAVKDGVARWVSGPDGKVKWEWIPR